MTFRLRGTHRQAVDPALLPIGFRKVAYRDHGRHAIARRPAANAGATNGREPLPIVETRKAAWHLAREETIATATVPATCRAECVGAVQRQ
jgi:hypothetical protein